MRPTHVSVLALAALLAAPALAQNAPDAQGKPPANAGQQAQAGGQQGQQAQQGQAGGQQEGADITVRQPAPQITVQQPPPQVTVRQPPPQVTIQQPKPDVTVRRAEPQVTVQQQGQPDVNVQQPGGGQQGQQGNPQNPLYAMRAEELVGRTIYGSNGEEIGEVDQVVVGRDGTPAAVVGVGGFLGLGEHNVAIPLDRLQPGEGERLTTSMTEEQLRSTGAYDATAHRTIEGDRVIGEVASG